MSEQNASMSPFPELRAALGQRLRAARDAAGLGREDLAQRLKLRPDIVDAIESGNYRALGAPVFVRGYLRSYASVVGIDFAELQPVFDGLGDAPQLGPSPITVRRNPWIERYSLAGTYLVGTVLVMSIIWAAVQTEGFGLVARLGQPPLPVVQTDTAVHELPLPTGPQPPAADVAAADGFERDADATLPDNGAGATEPEPSAPVMASMMPALDRGEARFSIRVEADTWLEIRDGNGKRLKYDIQKAGEQEYRGKPPFDLRVGNAGQAEVLVDGQPVDLGPYSRREIARLRLVASGGTLRPEALPRTTEARRAAPDTSER
jgi:cytoskeleton protein RodZ